MATMYATGVERWCSLLSGGRPPIDVILPSLADPPALIFASRRSLLSRACSEAVDGEAGVPGEDIAGDSMMSIPGSVLF